MKKVFFLVPEKGTKTIEFRITGVIIGTSKNPANNGDLVLPPLVTNWEASINSVSLGETQWFIKKINLPKHPNMDIRHAEVKKIGKFVGLDSLGILFKTNLPVKIYLKEGEI